MIPVSILQHILAAKTPGESALQLQSADKSVVRTLRVLSQLMQELSSGDRALEGRLSQRLAWEILRPVPPVLSGDFTDKENGVSNCIC